MVIRTANRQDIALLHKYDKWLSKEVMGRKLDSQMVYAAYEGEDFVGWLRYGLFWDNIPFMYMLYIMETYRGKGFGRALVKHWEAEMEKAGYGLVMTSSSQTEYAQHFYDALGYKAVGSFTPGSDPLEIIFSKNINTK